MLRSSTRPEPFRSGRAADERLAIEDAEGDPVLDEHAPSTVQRAWAELHVPTARPMEIETRGFQMQIILAQIVV